MTLGYKTESQNMLWGFHDTLPKSSDSAVTLFIILKHCNCLGGKLWYLDGTRQNIINIGQDLELYFLWVELR